MKKAKLMFLTIIVVGLVGGLLAFKASRFNGNLFCSANNWTTKYYNAAYSTTTIAGKILYCTTGIPIHSITYQVSTNP